MSIGFPSLPAMEATLTIRPYSFAFIFGSAA
jgi:hypothetical protein